MNYRFDLHVRLEAVHTANDPRAAREALRARVHDPLWFLGRQWQLGEHHGTDSASPALVHLTVTETPVTGRSAEPDDDPRVTPPEAIIESEPDQWWTIGRRVRVGIALRSKVPAPRREDPALLIAGLPAPYHPLNGQVLDGFALYRARVELSLTTAQFTALGVPATEPEDNWQPTELAYTANFQAGQTTLTIPRHDGGDIDWYSSTADNDAFAPGAPSMVRTSYPTRVSYDGAPHPRWWQIEDVRYDQGAVAPHRTRLASLMMIHLTASHGDGWFTAPLVSPTGTLVTVTRMQVEDVMGMMLDLPAAEDWSLFRITGRKPEELLVVPTVANPLAATTPLDDVTLGINEDANVLWAIERRVDGIELVEPDREDVPAPIGAPTGNVVVTAARRYRYVPSTAVPQLWHPYLMSDAGNVRRLVQARLADLNLRPVVPRPGPTSRLLRDPAAGPAEPAHQIAPGALPRTGLRIQRRHVLGRRVDGQPVLWVQRRRTSLLAPPVLSLRFDVLEEIPEVQP